MFAPKPIEATPLSTPLTPTATARGSSRLVVLVGVAAYLLWTGLTLGLRPEHVVVAGAYGFLALYPKTSSFARHALPFFVSGLLYDNFRLLADFRTTVRVDELYHAELAWFGIDTSAGRQILPWLLADYTHPVLDFICGLAYLLYLPQTFVVAAILYFVDRRRMTVLGLSFLLVNILGLITYLVYPAAPPWYVQTYGLGPAVLDAAPSSAGAARFDALLGVSVFEQFYSRSANVFGAMPSLHCAYPTVVFAAVWRMKISWALATGLFALLVMFSALYLQHHYVWDVVVGVLYAFIAAFVAETVLARWPSTRPEPGYPNLNTREVP